MSNKVDITDLNNSFAIMESCTENLRIVLRAYVDRGKPVSIVQEIQALASELLNAMETYSLTLDSFNLFIGNGHSMETTIKSKFNHFPQIIGAVEYLVTDAAEIHISDDFVKNLLEGLPKFICQVADYTSFEIHKSNVNSIQQFLSYKEIHQNSTNKLEVLDDQILCELYVLSEKLKYKLILCNPLCGTNVDINFKELNETILSLANFLKRHFLNQNYESSEIFLKLNLISFGEKLILEKALGKSRYLDTNYKYNFDQTLHNLCKALYSKFKGLDSKVGIEVVIQEKHSTPTQGKSNEEDGVGVNLNEAIPEYIEPFELTPDYTTLAEPTVEIEISSNAHMESLKYTVDEIRKEIKLRNFSYGDMTSKLRLSHNCIKNITDSNTPPDETFLFNLMRMCRELGISNKSITLIYSSLGGVRQRNIIKEEFEVIIEKVGIMFGLSRENLMYLMEINCADFKEAKKQIDTNPIALLSLLAKTFKTTTNELEKLLAPITEHSTIFGVYLSEGERANLNCIKVSLSEEDTKPLPTAYSIKDIPILIKDRLHSRNISNKDAAKYLNIPTNDVTDFLEETVELSKIKLVQLADLLQVKELVIEILKKDADDNLRDFSNGFGQIILIKLLAATELSVGELSDLCGISVETLKDIEYGQESLHYSQLTTIAKSLSLGEEDILAAVDSIKPEFDWDRIYGDCYPKDIRCSGVHLLKPVEEDWHLTAEERKEEYDNLPESTKASHNMIRDLSYYLGVIKKINPPALRDYQIEKIRKSLNIETNNLPHNSPKYK